MGVIHLHLSLAIIPDAMPSSYNFESTTHQRASQYRNAHTVPYTVQSGLQVPYTITYRTVRSLDDARDRDRSLEIPAVGTTEPEPEPEPERGPSIRWIDTRSAR